MANVIETVGVEVAVKDTKTPLKPSLAETMRPEVTETLLANMTRRIVETFHPIKVVLFGSYAYGYPNKESDLDVLVIMDSEETPHKRVIRVRQIAKIPFLPLDVIVRTPQEVAQRLAMGDFFLKEILDKGRVLYENDTDRRVERQGRR